MSQAANSYCSKAIPVKNKSSRLATELTTMILNNTWDAPRYSIHSSPGCSKRDLIPPAEDIWGPSVTAAAAATENG